MAERMRYTRPEIHEVLLETSQAVLSSCRSSATSAKVGDTNGWCKKACKQNNKKSGSNSQATS